MLHMTPNLYPYTKLQDKVVAKDFTIKVLKA